MLRDSDLEAPWVGKSREDYYGYDENDEDEYESDVDEDFAYESWRDTVQEKRVDKLRCGVQ